MVDVFVNAVGTIVSVLVVLVVLSLVFGDKGGWVIFLGLACLSAGLFCVAEIVLGGLFGTHLDDDDTLSVIIMLIPWIGLAVYRVIGRRKKQLT
jgi:hypothetical protein